MCLLIRDHQRRPDDAARGESSIVYKSKLKKDENLAFSAYKHDVLSRNKCSGKLVGTEICLVYDDQLAGTCVDRQQRT